MLLKKVIFIIFAVLILAEGGYFLHLMGKLRELENQKKPENTKISKPIQTEHPEIQQESTSHLVAQKEKPSMTGEQIQEEINRRLSRQHGKPIEEVIQEYEPMLEQSPNDADRHLKLGKIYLHLPGKREKACEHFARILELCPDHPQKEFLEMWTRITTETKDKKKLLEEIKIQKQRLETHPKNPQEYIELAGMYKCLKAFPAAITTYKKALELDSNNPQVFLELGQLTKDDHYQDALGYFQKVLELQPEHPEKSEISKWIQDLEQKIEQKYVYSTEKVEEEKLISSLKVQISRASIYQQQEAIKRLGTLKSNNAVDVLVEYIKQRGKERLYQEVLMALCRIGTSYVKLQLIQILYEPDIDRDLKMMFLRSYPYFSVQQEDAGELKKWLEQPTSQGYEQEVQQVLQLLNQKISDGKGTK